MTPCPPGERLEQWLSAGDDAALADHVETCADCQAVLERLTAAPSAAPTLPPGGEQATPQQPVRFGAEAEIMARLSHPNFVQVYEAGAHRGQPYLAMEFVDGRTLAPVVSGHPARTLPGVVASQSMWATRREPAVDSRIRR